MQVQGLDTRDWPQRGEFYHRTSGGAYGPSLPGETLKQYKSRVRGAYGTLAGVSFHTLNVD